MQIFSIFRVSMEAGLVLVIYRNHKVPIGRHSMMDSTIELLGGGESMREHNRPDFLLSICETFGHWSISYGWKLHSTVPLHENVGQAAHIEMDGSQSLAINAHSALIVLCPCGIWL